LEPLTCGIIGFCAEKKAAMVEGGLNVLGSSVKLKVWGVGFGVGGAGLKGPGCRI
jgi:hypothetical protein